MSEERKAFGTSDVAILGDGELHTIDEKFGYTAVVAQGNKQLALYAADILYTLDELSSDNIGGIAVYTK